MTLLSPYTVSSIKDVPTNNYNSHHKLLLHRNKKYIDNETSSLIYRRSYIINCLSTFIYRALEKRQKYINNIRENEKNRNTFVFNFNKSSEC